MKSIATHMKEVVQPLKEMFQSSDCSLQIFLCLVWCYNILVFMRATFLHIIPSEVITVIFVPTIYVFACISSYSHWLKKIRLTDLLFANICIFIYLSQYFLFPSNSEVLDQYLYEFIGCTLPYFFIGLIIDIDQQKKAFYYLSILCILCQFAYTFLYSFRMRGTMAENNEYEMGLAYSILPQILYTIGYLYKKVSFTGILIALAGCFLILSYGTRGPLACVLFFVVVQTIFVLSKRKRIIIGFILAIVFILSYIFREAILNFLLDLLDAVGVSSRIVSKLIEAELSGEVNSSGRDTIATAIIDAIKVSPFGGYGIGGSWAISGGYAHNLVLDFLVTYGIVGGSLLLIIFFITICIGYFHVNSTETKTFFLLLFTCGVVKLFVSNTYIKEPYFFFMLGFAINMIRNNKIIK